MSLFIRPATPTDAVVVAEFNSRLALESEHLHLEPAVLAAGVAVALADPERARYFVAETGGEVVGQLMLTREWSDWRNGWIWWVQSVYVRADARRQGVFRALFEYVEQLVDQDPTVLGLRLYVEQENTVAQETYLRVGMAKAGYLVLEKLQRGRIQRQQ
jgi:GNAT superfamily N-acetyltransferase